MNQVTEILEFLTNREGGDKELCEFVEKDLGIKVDWECSNLVDEATGKSLNVSLEDIVKAVKNRIVISINSFDDENSTSTETESMSTETESMLCSKCGSDSPIVHYCVNCMPLAAPPNSKSVE